ncbi:MAG: putative beta-lysine N-acetyltransferase [Bdellovibrionales bacterium CG12_big_fil_rev_8_21_14_0_65_38_15]|nr:MAG: putative beta-lysine N-acetyltransferase [Bdellovibrionales bacterium CG22_combo_CG10-13_8_21_14_all_38_13]PIQ53375.1 MAG: putative beta-lysine N-acetyltransferase [Bdellovibrionales bacterium CG12_big_fil_rev_8_21_14_0_65_38_15]PIR30262.1 MAG: putative beta-lysine N-acetyltransferase [Bdellovibrionales bacterium CG11_big_fil_rev_8_21_14_0_20_38_13]
MIKTNDLIVTVGDVVEKIAGATIQHGEFNDRIYLMKMNDDISAKQVIVSIEELALENNYGKIFIKTPQSRYLSFLENGYEIEATIPGFYKGVEQAIFMVKYIDQERRELEKPALVQEVIEVSQDKDTIRAQGLPSNYMMRELTLEDTEEMAAIYSEIFPTYPFPIHQSEYLKTVMSDYVRSFGVYDPEGKLVSVAACEIDKNGLNVEMTDFATLPDYRGQGLAHEILYFMEAQMKQNGIKTAYTIARARSFGMNITFSKAGYEFAGMLKNNTNISGSIQSMNVWYKQLN